MAGKPSDIESIQKVLRQIEQFSLLRKSLPTLGHLLDQAGVDRTALIEALASLDPIRENLAELTGVMDRFNEIFAPRGWIAYGQLDPEVANQAIAAVDAGSLIRAEQVLVDYFDPDEVASQLRPLGQLQAFQPRMHLAQLALVDYREKRYHASTPVVLALLDGMVNDCGRYGFFSEAVDLDAWDLMAACDTGLKSLQKLLHKSRPKTRTEAIEVPYRNGILHGTDLGYGTRIVAAKSWAALFAAADWVRRVESGKKEAPAPESEPSLRDVRDQLRKIEEEKARLNSWVPRSVSDGDALEDGSPEAALVEFLDAWKSRNYGHMARRLQDFSGMSFKRHAGEVRSFYEILSLEHYRIRHIADKTAAITEVEVEGSGTQLNRRFNRIATFRLVYLLTPA